MLAPYESHLLEALRSLPAKRQEELAKSCIELLTLTAQEKNCPGVGVHGYSCGYAQDTCGHCLGLVTTFMALGR